MQELPRTYRATSALNPEATTSPRLAACFAVIVFPSSLLRLTGCYNYFCYIDRYPPFKKNRLSNGTLTRRAHGRYKCIYLSPKRRGPPFEPNEYWGCFYPGPGLEFHQDDLGKKIGVGFTFPGKTIVVGMLNTSRKQ
ncbi:hypothetical protein F5Y03DRAFT_113599 [Xylaria venustula]|nr:hypothetical protein F5Y03DRAFT_113599 [Xylaria venustula]